MNIFYQDDIPKGNLCIFLFHILDKYKILLVFIYFNFKIIIFIIAIIIIITTTTTTTTTIIIISYRIQWFIYLIFNYIFY